MIVSKRDTSFRVDQLDGGRIWSQMNLSSSTQNTTDYYGSGDVDLMERSLLRMSAGPEMVDEESRILSR
jgi:hypothetical protein